MPIALRSWLKPDLLLAGPANQNWIVLAPPQTPAGALQEARLTREWLLRRVARQPELLWDSQWRLLWDNTLAFERCVTWRLEQRWP